MIIHSDMIQVFFLEFSVLLYSVIPSFFFSYKIISTFAGFFYDMS